MIFLFAIFHISYAFQLTHHFIVFFVQPCTRMHEVFHEKLERNRLCNWRVECKHIARGVRIILSTHREQKHDAPHQSHYRSHA